MSAMDIAVQVFYITASLADAVSDFSSGVFFIGRGDLWWGGLTICSVLLAMFVTTIILSIYAINWKWKKPRVGLLLVCFPIVPVGTLVWDLYVKVWEYKHGGNVSNNNDSEINVNNDNNYRTMHENDQNMIDNSEINHSMNSNSSINTDDTTINYETNVSDGTSGNFNSDKESLISSDSSIIISESNSNNIMDNTGSNDNNIDIIDIVTNDDSPPQTEAPVLVKLSESLTESVPLTFLYTHIIFYALYHPEALGTVDIFQWISIAISVCYIALSIALNGGFNECPTWKKFLVFLLLLPAISCRLMICGTFGTIHSALFILPIGTEIIALIITVVIWECCDVYLWRWDSFKLSFSSIYFWFSVGGVFINKVPMGLSITTLSLSFLTCPIQTWIWKNFVTTDNS